MPHSLRDLPGIGVKTEQLFEKVGVRSQEDLLAYYPRGYDLYRSPVRLDEAVAGEVNTVEAVILKTPSVRSFSGRSITIALISDGESAIQADWFNMPYLRTKLRPGMRFIFRGLLTEKGSRRILTQPKLFTPAEYEQIQGRMLPLYSLTAGLSNQTISKAVRGALGGGIPPGETLPESIREKRSLIGLSEATGAIHFPVSREELARARRRLVYDEFFYFLLGVERLRTKNGREPNGFPMPKQSLQRKVRSSLPYELTDGQKEILEAVLGDLSSDHRMHRLIQGDVGSGKTILAFLAMLTAYENGFQCALMVPTEVLAIQHAKALLELLPSAGIDPHEAVLLTGSLRKKEKQLAHERIATGEARMVIGTHALIQEGVSFDRLGLVITDEQHRFGVLQRETLSGKGEQPHVLVMSATPIPRTLAMMLYGDLDQSSLKEMPASRRPIKNAVVDRSYRPAAYRFLKKETAAGHQAYVICPMVEESEAMDAENVTDYAVKLKHELGDGVRIEILHGRMKPAEKEQVMTRFADGKIDILVSTTVVEVGVNVPNATVMMVENAERFGLAQLHQLRGRVGRGKDQSYCIFVSGKEKGTIPERLNILSRSNDGFEIAEEDLKQRGPGDLFGVRQSGIALFQLGDIYADHATLTEADEDAKGLIAGDPELRLAEHRSLARELDRRISRNSVDVSAT